jgi:hypothetical protein
MTRARDAIRTRHVTAVCVLALPVFLSLGGCHGSRQSPRQEGAQPAAFGNDRGQDSAGPVAVVGGQRLTKAMLADHWFDRYPEEYARTLNSLIDEKVALADARRLGIRVPAAVLEKAVAAEVEARRKQIRSIYGEKATLQDEVSRAYGLDVAAWRKQVLGPRLHVRLLMERVIRWATHGRDRVHARVIVMDDGARARRVAAKIQRGADFSLTALKESKDPSGKRGGNLPMIGRGDLAFPGVEERLFAASPGSLVGPLEVRVDGAPQWQIYRIVSRREAWQGSYESSWQRLEKDLAERPVAAAEFTRWRARVRRGDGVRYYRPDGRTWSPPGRR